MYQFPAEIDPQCVDDRKPGRTPHVFASIFSLTYGFSGKTSQAMSECIHQILATNRHSRPAPFEVVATALEQDLDNRPVWRFDRDMDLAWLASTLFQQPGNHVSKAGATMAELALSDPLTHVIAE